MLNFDWKTLANKFVFILNQVQDAQAYRQSRGQGQRDQDRHPEHGRDRSLPRKTTNL